jgi:hypothetical protein
MTRLKFTLFGLCAFVLGAMAFGAGAAQAETGAKWLIVDPDSKTLDAANLSAALGAEMENNHFTLLTNAFGSSTNFLCGKLVFIGFFLEKEGSLTKGGKTQFRECLLILNEVVIPCTVHSPGAAPGVIESYSLKGLLVLHELKPSGVKDELIRIEPAEGILFTLIECEEIEFPITGKLFLKDSLNELLTHKVVHLVQEGPLSTLAVAGKAPMVIDGSANLFLTGAHTGLRWGGDPA